MSDLGSEDSTYDDNHNEEKGESPVYAPADDIITDVGSAKDGSGDNVSEISSTRAMDEGITHQKVLENLSQVSNKDILLPNQTADDRRAPRAASLNTSMPSVVPFRARLPAKPSHAVSRQQSRASILASQMTPRLPGINNNSQGGELKRADGAMGSIDLNRSVMESLISTDDRKKDLKSKDGRWPSPKRSRVPARFVKVSRVSLSTR